jgi:hypothetical protein
VDVHVDVCGCVPTYFSFLLTLSQYLIKEDPRYVRLQQCLLDKRRDTLQKALNAKKLVEVDTAEVVRVLQQRG